MNTLEKLQKQFEKDQELIGKLQDKSNQLEAAILQDPDNTKAAIEAAATDKQLEYANKAKAATWREIEAEKQREYEREVKTAQNVMADIEKKTNAIKELELAKVQAFYEEYENWLALVNRHAELARKYKLPAGNLYALDEGQGGITRLKWAIDQWTAAMQSSEVRRQFLQAIRNE